MPGTRRLVRAVDDPLEVSPEVPLHIPLPFGDCELFVDVELEAGTELDLVVRKVEPTLRYGDMPLYHGRFAVLRLSTEESGRACLTREQALFDDGSVGGHLLGAGKPATIVLEARGRTVRALVAGERLELAATDAHGTFASQEPGLH